MKIDLTQWDEEDEQARRGIELRKLARSLVKGYIATGCMSVMVGNRELTDKPIISCDPAKYKNARQVNETSIRMKALDMARLSLKTKLPTPSIRDDQIECGG